MCESASIEAELPALPRQLAGQQSQKGRLATTRRASDSKHLPRTNHQRGRFENSMVSETMNEITNDELTRSRWDGNDPLSVGPDDQTPPTNEAFITFMQGFDPLWRGPIDPRHALCFQQADPGGISLRKVNGETAMGTALCGGSCHC